MAPHAVFLAVLLAAAPAGAQALKAPVALDEAETADFFRLAKAGLLSKKIMSDAEPRIVRCVIQSFLKSSYSKTFDDAAYEKLVDAAVAGTELFYFDAGCREKLKHPEANVVAIAVPAASHAVVVSACGHKYGDPKKDSILIFSKQSAKGIPTTAHEVAHIMLSSLDKPSPKWNVHHGLTNYLHWGKGTPAKPWFPGVDECKKAAGSQSVGLLNFSGGEYDRADYQPDETEHDDSLPSPAE